MCNDCGDTWYEDEDDDELDEAVELSYNARRFIKSLLDLDRYAIEHAESFYRAVEPAAPVAKPTYVIHTLWTCQEVGGFFYYTVKHDLESTVVEVSLDSLDSFSFKPVDENTVSIVSSEKLWGVDVTVKRTGL